MGTRPEQNSQESTAQECRMVEEGLVVLEMMQQTLPGLAQDAELISDFVLEAREHIRQVEAQLLLLDSNPSGGEPLHICFRAFHTIKGLAGFLEFGILEQFCHETETLLDSARSGALAVNSEVIDLLLAATDFVAAEISVIECRAAGDQVPRRDSAEPLLKRIRAAVIGTGENGPTETAVAFPDQTPAVIHQSSSGEKRLVRVDTAKLDHLVEVIGELVIAQSLVRNDPILLWSDSAHLNRNLSQLGRITNELQKAALGIRLVPVGQLFGRITRLIRDLSRKSGKPVELKLHGEEIELDRNIVEELADPLMHMVRNAVDHGIETPDERRIAGKPEIATIVLAAAHRAGRIVIQVSDDGRGLDRNKILAKAEQRGLTVSGQTLCDQDVFALIFEAGFSTAERVTDLSGRGVGMDVVRKQIHKLRGRIETQSTAGKGTTFTLRLPLTLAIIDGLVLAVGSSKFLLPISSIREVIKPKPDMISTVENRSEIALVRGQLLPVVRLNDRFCMQTENKDILESLLVVVESSDRSFCLVIDELLGKQEVVIKSLGHLFADIPGIAGGAILADGKVGLLLDPEAILEKAHHSAA